MNKLIVAKRAGQSYYEITFDQPGVPQHVITNTAETIRRLLNERYFVTFAGKSVMFVDCSMFDALMSNRDFAYSDQIIVI